MRKFRHRVYVMCVTVRYRVYDMYVCCNITGQTLTGAGGGGFVVLLTKEPNMADKVKAVIQENRVFNFYIDFFKISFHLSNLHRPLKN